MSSSSPATNGPPPPENKADQPLPTLLAAMSHDLRTPMNGVLGMAELLLADEALDPRHRRRVEIINRSGTTLLAMLDPILELAKIETTPPKSDSSPIDLRAMISDLINSSNNENQSEIIQLADVDDHQNHHHLLGNAPLIQRLLKHFLDCATKLKAEAPIITSIEQAGHEDVRIEFRADVPDADIDTVDQLLTSSDGTTAPPTGQSLNAAISLILCKKLAAMMDGDIIIDRHPTARATLRLTITLATDPDHRPIAQPAENKEIPPPTADPNTSPTTALHILIAEDDPDMAYLIEDLLDEAGHRTTIAPDGASIFRALDEGLIDLVLMDGRLPDMSGAEATKRIRDLSDPRATLPIIALTGEVLSGDRERFLSAGMDEYIAKPVDFETLTKTIESCYSRKKSAVLSIENITNSAS